jgi:hypothetical protein
MDYEDRLIIYIDILGFSKFVNDTTLSKIDTSEKIKKIDSFLKMINNFFNDDKFSTLSKSRQTTSFSDLIVMSINLEEVDNLDFEIAEIYHLLISSAFHGFLLRGAIVYGKLIHTKDVIFGSGLIDAYEKERNIAKYPRIIIDDVVYADYLALYEKRLTIHNAKNYISRDIDGIYYIDLFYELRDSTDNVWEYTRILNSYCNILLELIGNPTLFDKYTWLKDKFIAHVNYNKELLGHWFPDSSITKDDIGTMKMILDDFNNDNFKKIL